MIRLRSLWIGLIGSLWFVPSSIVLGAILLALAMVELSSVVASETLARYPRFFGSNADSSRDLLAAIAGSMITVAGVTFSITMVAVTQASSQYTPRILRNFTQDRVNQVFLGIFVGVFAYCLVVMRTIRGEEEQAFVPSLAVLLAVLLALLGIAVLIFFVHHIATILQASEIVARIMRETSEAVERLFPEKLGEGAPADGDDALLEAVPTGHWRPVPAPATGYVQTIDAGRILKLARECGLLIRLERVTGDFVVEGVPIAWYACHPASRTARDPAEEAADAIAEQYVVGTYRTVDQDPAFGLQQLVDIAVKALSPGVNDTTTAVTCVEYLGAILIRLADRRIEFPCRRDGVLVRIVAPGPSFEGLLLLAFDDIRRNARGNLPVLSKQLETIALVAGCTRSPARRARVLEQVEPVLETGLATLESKEDQARLRRLAQAVSVVPLE